MRQTCGGRYGGSSRLKKLASPRSAVRLRTPGAANAGADAVACAAVLHYKKETVTELKEDIRAGGVEVRQV